MFISKRAFNEAINKAVRETEEKCWLAYDKDRAQRYENERMEKIDERLRKVEVKCGLVEPKINCPCGMAVSPTII